LKKEGTMSRRDCRDNYEQKPARAVRGGIKAQSKSGLFGESWWARRRIAVLESFDIGALGPRALPRAQRAGDEH
jgi:hypothetical protein